MDAKLELERLVGMVGCRRLGEAERRTTAQALKTIKDRRMYRITHSSFESFVRERFGFSGKWAYKLIRMVSEVKDGC